MIINSIIALESKFLYTSDMATQTVSLQTNLVIELIQALKTKGLSPLRKKILLGLPDETFRYGSDLWWEQSEIKATDDIKKGKGVTFKNTQEALKWLHEQQ